MEKKQNPKFDINKVDPISLMNGLFGFGSSSGPPGKYQAKTLGLIGQVQEILNEYQARLTVRQIYYRLVAKQIIPNDLQSYKRLDSILSNARKSGDIPFEAIIDRTRIPIKNSSWPNLGNFLTTVRQAYRKSKWDNQEKWVEVWLEKDALSGVFEPITNEYDVYLVVGRGYQSLSALYDASSRFGRSGKPVYILYFGDFDPTGEDIPRSIESNLINYFGISPNIEKVALTLEDIKAYSLPPAPTKASDPRSNRFVQEYGDLAVELDALPPDVLEEKIRTSIEKHLDREQFQEDLKVEKRENKKLAVIIQELKQ